MVPLSWRDDVTNDVGKFYNQGTNQFGIASDLSTMRTPNKIIPIGNTNSASVFKKSLIASAAVSKAARRPCKYSAA